MKNISKYLESKESIVPLLEMSYKKWNEILFKGVLGKELNTYPIRTESMKKGVYAKTVSYQTNTGVYIAKEIIFSSSLELGDPRLKGILVHEMIHVHLIENLTDNLEESPHGEEFIRIVEILQNEVSFLIPKRWVV